jgi:hypothetical protein
MGEAKRRKLAGIKPAAIKTIAMNQLGRQFLDGAAPKVMQRLHAEMAEMPECVEYTRILAGSGKEVLLYSPDDPEAASPLDGLVGALRRRYQSPRKVPLWLVPLILEEPWELVMRGYGVSYDQVWTLHALFPSFPQSAEQTWARCVEEDDAIRARQEAQALRARNAGRSIAPYRATI